MQPHEDHAIVEEVAAGDGAVRLTVRFEDGRVRTNDLRADLAPEGLAAGVAVGVTEAALYRRWKVRILDGS